MKYRDKLIKYFEDAPEGAVIVANDMYENGFTKMSHDAFFRAVERYHMIILATHNLLTKTVAP